VLLLATLPSPLLTLLLLPSDICSQPALLLATQANLPTPVLLSLPQLLLLLLRLPALMLFAGTSLQHRQHSPLHELLALLLLLLLPLFIPTKQAACPPV
jgi:hypothetical protein